MSDAGSETLTAFLASAESLLPSGDSPLATEVLQRIVALLGDAERASPGGAALHAQLDTVAKWMELLCHPDEHVRFGGSARVHDHVRLQLRLARAAADDYARATS
jgi:hypothetical protein